MTETLSLANPVFKQFAFYSAVCLLKMFALTFYTVKFRMTKMVFANPEDIKGMDRPENWDKNKPNFGDEDVERVRRNHLNDLENIPAFVLIGLLYVLTGPSLSTALLHFRVFTASRVLHTLAYQIPLPQPTRGLAFFVGVVVTLSMAVQVIMATC